jgi:hypothetical protein
MYQGTKETGDVQLLGCIIWVKLTRDVSSGDISSLHQLVLGIYQHNLSMFILLDHCGCELASVFTPYDCVVDWVQ